MTLDWQSVVVTVIALGAALVIVRRFMPARRRPTSARATGAPAAVACDHCETGARATAAAAREASGRTATTQVVSVADLRATAKRH